MNAAIRSSRFLIFTALALSAGNLACDKKKSTGTSSAVDSASISSAPSVASVQLAASHSTDSAAAPQKPALTTVGAKFQRIGRINPKWLARDELALRMALDLSLAATKADGKRAAGLLDAVGYQTLPLTGELPEHPPKPLAAAAFQAQVAQCKPVSIDNAPLSAFSVVSRETLRKTLPAAAEWMLAEDFAVLIQPAEQTGGDWIARPCCVIVRIRAHKATVIGGNLLEALK